MASSIGLFNISDFVKKMEGKTLKNSFIKHMEGIHSSKVTVKNYSFGEPTGERIYRKYNYNKNGQVVKKISYNSDGRIQMKELYHYDRKGKITRSKFITENSVIREKYDYKRGSGYLDKYYFWDADWPHTKKEHYTVEEYVKADGENSFRKIKKISYGLLGFPELITYYLYDDNTNKYRFRHVTNPDGELIMTFLYTNDERGNLHGIYGFAEDPDGIKELMKTNNKWELESKFRSIWEYDSNNNPVGFQRDEPEDELALLKESSFFGTNSSGRVITQKTTSEFENIEGRYFLVKTTEWLPRYDEPLKETKEFTYYDKDGNIVYPVPIVMPAPEPVKCICTCCAEKSE